jgi:hypothetical protein
MSLPEVFGYDEIQTPANCFIRREAENTCRRCVPHPNHSRGVGKNHGVRRLFDDRSREFVP